MIFTQSHAFVKKLVTADEIHQLARKLKYALNNDRCLIGRPVSGNDRFKTGLFLTDDQRSTHMLVMGRSGGGKSRLIEFMIRQDLLRGLGVCVIDPHGELFFNLVRFIIKYMDVSVYERLFIFDPSNKDVLINFNPFLFSGKHDSPNIRTDNIISLIEKASGSSLDDKPGIRDAIKNIIYPALLADLSVLGIKELFFSSDSRRSFFDSFVNLSSAVPKSVYYYWESLFKNPKKTDEYLLNSIGGAHRRLEILLDSPALQMMSVSNSPVTMDQIIDSNGIFLANLAVSDSFSLKNQSVIGSMLLNDFVKFFFSRSRAFISSGDPERKESFTPFYLYIDEYHNFISRDLADILSGGRKFGLHVVLANQTFAQIPPDLMDAVNNIATTKAFFSVKDIHTAIEIYQQTSGAYSPRLKDVVKRFTSIPDDLRVIEDVSRSVGPDGNPRETRSERHVQNHKIIETEDKSYFTPNEVDLIEGKNIQMLPKRKFLCFTEGLTEAAILETEWCFDLDVSVEQIERFIFSLQINAPLTYSKVSVLKDYYNKQAFRSAVDPVAKEVSDEEKNPFNTL